jgi:erythromycin esterase-like protein
MNARNEGGLWSALEQPPEMMGLHLRAALGHDIIIIGTSAASNGGGLPAVPPDSGSVDAALARVGLRRFLVDLRAASTDREVSAWLAERRPLRANFTTTLMVAPQSAFDALLFVDTLTPSRTAPP